MTELTISHTAEQGTLLKGTTRGDGTHEVMRDVQQTVGHWRWAPSLCQWIVVSSRDRQPKQVVIDAAATALREAGFTVHMRIDRTARDTALAEADRGRRQADRAEALRNKASRKDAAAVAADTAHDRAWAALPSGGEPIKIGHHSEQRHRRAIEKVRDTLDRSVQADRDAASAHSRADAAASTTDHRYSPRTVANRIETLEAEQRREQRILDGYTRVLGRDDHGVARHTETHEPATGQYRDLITARITQRDGEIVYWKQVRTQQIADGLSAGYEAADFTVGDFVRVAGSWRQITKVNKKSVSVVAISGRPRAIHTIAAKNRSDRYISTDHTVRYHHISADMTEARARELFPDLLEDLDAAPLPARPKRRGGPTKLEHRCAAEAELWYWNIDSVEYTAVWRHPTDWYATPPAPVTDPAVVRISAQTRANGHLRGESIALPVTDFPISGPVCWPEEVHNQVRVIVEKRAYLPTTRG